jgi:NuA3 HAT complex component NTO1
MASTDLSLRRPTRTPARSRVNSRSELATEPPNKRRKFVPGGLGGGGHWDNDNEGQPAQMESITRSSRALTAPRARSRRLSTEVGDKNDEAETPTVTRSAMQTRPRRERPERYVPPVTAPRPRYSNSSSAAAASQASDGYKPREERGWEEFHPDLDLDAGLMIFSADEVDGRTRKDDIKAAIAQLEGSNGDNKPTANGDGEVHNIQSQQPAASLETPTKRRPGRPPRQQTSMLSGLGLASPIPIKPLPTHSSKERLNLPKPSFRHFSHFLAFEEDQNEIKVNYVDRTMANVGYQESDRFELPARFFVRLSEAQQADDEAEMGLRLESDGPVQGQVSAPMVGKVEYDMDEQDVEWLDVMNEQRKSEGVDAIKPAIFEITMTQIEKEYHALEKRIPKPQPRHAQLHRPRSSSQAAVNGDPNPPGDEPDSKCSICDDGDCENANAIIFCDGCDLAVHQECYGVPFIPEGQWFCRKCKEIGRGTPTCIFCPNVDGAFKQTNTLRWSHLLCSIWIPEVTIANTTFMEPITDVDKVPKSRWKLNCYICQQKMGACIQCGNKNCYLAFHVTCARKAKLFLKMKSQQQGSIDSTVLKAFCDKHVPPDWRRTHDTDNAIVEAKRWYRHAMKDRKWADSQTAALELGAPPAPDGGMLIEGQTGDDTITVANQKRKRAQPAKVSWRLPSGAPVVPNVVYNTVEKSLERFTIRKRKEFVEKACRYWTLKREARRGAALLKRLQLQLETFSSMEITRRNFVGMGAAGRPRLQRRIEFGEMLQKDMDYQVQLTSMVKEREALRLQELLMLREQIDTVYTPIPTLVWPILQRVQRYVDGQIPAAWPIANRSDRLDEREGVFRAGTDVLAHRLRERYYTSVSDFSRDLSQIFLDKLAENDNLDPESSADINTIHQKLNEVPAGTAEHHALSHDQKELKKLAKRIVKAVKELTEGAVKKEAELRGLQHDEAMRKIESLALFSADVTKSIEPDAEDDRELTKRRSFSNASAVAGASPDVKADVDVEMHDADGSTEDVVTSKAANLDNPTPASMPASTASSVHSHTVKTNSSKPTEPLSPPISTASVHRPGTANGHHTQSGENDVYTNGGVAWYLTPFDPMGTTVHEERYTGREVMRDMSEELSDMDEDTLMGLELSGMDDSASGAAGSNGSTAAGAAADLERANNAPPAAKKRPKRKRNHW